MADELELAANPDAEFEDDGDEVVVKLKEKSRNRKGRGFGKGSYDVVMDGTEVRLADASMRESRGEYEAMETGEGDGSGPGPQRCK